jgi:CDP-diacylglycerol--glycerol-3-phosphate 3-phosphatidyltransferase
MTTANAISVSRLPLAVAFLLAQSTFARLAILGAAALSDFLDGWIARRHAQSSRAGELIDPVADKIFLVTALISLAAHGAIGRAALLILLARDFFTIAGFVAVLVLKLPVRLQSRFAGKVVTTLQLATVLVLTAVPALATPAVWIVAAATAWSVFDYIGFGVRSLHADSLRTGSDGR